MAIVKFKNDPELSKWADEERGRIAVLQTHIDADRSDLAKRRTHWRQSNKGLEHDSMLYVDATNGFKAESKAIAARQRKVNRRLDLLNEKVGEFAAP